MGVLLFFGVMVVTAAAWRFFLRVAERSTVADPVDHGESGQDPARPLVIPDRVPAEWVAAYRRELGG
jgi:hypothetical protein